MDNKDRISQNKRNDELESVLHLLNEALADDEQDLTENFEKPRYPVFFIVGNARSGTTLLYQWLASTGLFAYPSNIISRFYKAPYVGALIHKVFVHYDKFRELLGGHELTFESTLGKTKGGVSPHEFWYFWRRFFDFDEIQKLSKKDLSQVDSESFVKELAALEGAFDKPLLLKGMILNWNLEYLKQILTNAVFIHLQRDVIYNMHSLYTARKKFFGDINKWYSFKPPEYAFLKNLNVYQQLAGQVKYTNRAIVEGLEAAQGDTISINYEDFCANPRQLFLRIRELLDRKGYKIEQEYQGPNVIELRNTITDSKFDISKAKGAIKSLTVTE
ncbi:Sulfotransferase family protein [Fodinibius roseus]|uniref:Sulfotransferase family protein n=1 Tax=Fodinibius roseus TaxID=1194090 RepID=A0A1M5GL82_9BACT|nr:sulfotransferase [Fodinibius roseus]SHG04520.1 Sulfotransferase family protein [Fodinibius roseus]